LSCSSLEAWPLPRVPLRGKALSLERMDQVTLMPSEGLPHDRRFAIARGSTPVG
jgi:hypothetical protein